MSINRVGVMFLLCGLMGMLTVYAIGGWAGIAGISVPVLTTVYPNPVFRVVYTMTVAVFVAIYYDYEFQALEKKECQTINCVE